jgi:hypothetical protein
MLNVCVPPDHRWGSWSGWGYVNRSLHSCLHTCSRRYLLQVFTVDVQGLFVVWKQIRELTGAIHAGTQIRRE